MTGSRCTKSPPGCCPRTWVRAPREQARARFVEGEALNPSGRAVFARRCIVPASRTGSRTASARLAAISLGAEPEGPAPGPGCAPVPLVRSISPIDRFGWPSERGSPDTVTCKGTWSDLPPGRSEIFPLLARFPRRAFFFCGRPAPGVERPAGLSGWLAPIVALFDRTGPRLQKGASIAHQPESLSAQGVFQQPVNSPLNVRAASAWGVAGWPGRGIIAAIRPCAGRDAMTGEGECKG